MSVKKAREAYVDSGHISNSTLNEFTEKDPTKSNKYTYCMLKWCLEEGVKRDVVFRAIDNFHRNEKRIELKDVYAYKSFKAFAIASSEAEDERVVNKRRRKSKLDDRLRGDGVHVMLDREAVYIAQPLTENASILMGKRTKWCTTSSISDNHFNQYYLNSDIIIMYMFDDCVGKCNKMAIALYPEEFNPASHIENEGLIEQYIGKRFCEVFNAVNERITLQEVYDKLDANKVKHDIFEKFIDSPRKLIMTGNFDELFKLLSTNKYIIADADLARMLIDFTGKIDNYVDEFTQAIIKYNQYTLFDKLMELAKRYDITSWANKLTKHLESLKDK